MKSIIRRIEELEKRLMPRSLTARDRVLLVRMEAGRRRVREEREARGASEPSDEGLPPKRVHASRGIQLTMDILNEGPRTCPAPQLEGQETSPVQPPCYWRWLMPR